MLGSRGFESATIAVRVRDELDLASYVNYMYMYISTRDDKLVDELGAGDSCEVEAMQGALVKYTYTLMRLVKLLLESWF